MSETLTIRRPDDWHVHLRDGEMLRSVVGHTARQFARAIVMPNLTPPVTRAADASAYRERIVAPLPEGAEFTPLTTSPPGLRTASSPRPSSIRRARRPTRPTA